jgi:ornithine decarboxylase
VDAEAEPDKVIRRAPGATVYVRISTDGAGADWPLSRKFGCSPADALRLLRKAAHAGLRFGLSFHVGSQQRDVTAWDRALADVAALVRTLSQEGFEAAGVNLGGGLPCQYREPVADISAYGEAIRRALASHLGQDFAGEVLVEPGRYLVGDAGVIQTEVVLISRRPADDQTRWVYLDIGMFNGLTETLEEAIRYRVGVPPGRGGTFVNTWSVDGFISEGLQPAEIGWGTHERWLPPSAHYHPDPLAPSIYLNRPGADTRVRTGVPPPDRSTGCA